MYGAGNLGDDLLMAAVRGVLERAGVEVVVAAHSPFPPECVIQPPIVPVPALSRRFLMDVATFVER